MTDAYAEPPLPARSPAAYRLFVFRCALLGWTVVYPLVMRLILSSSIRSGAMDGLDIATELFWAVISAIHVGLLVGLRREFAGHPAAGLLRAAVGLEVVTLVSSLAFAGARIWGRDTAVALGLGSSAVTVFFTLVSLAFDVVFWLSLERLLGRVDVARRAAFFVLRLAAVGVTAFSILAFESYRSLMFKAAFSLVLQLLRMGISVGWNAVVVVTLYRLWKSAPSPAPASAAPAAPDSTTDLIMGGVWLGGGLLVTLGSYSAASGPGGGRYVVTTGAIVYGIIRLGRGLVRLGRR